MRNTPVASTWLPQKRNRARLKAARTEMTIDTATTQMVILTELMKKCWKLLSWISSR